MSFSADDDELEFQSNPLMDSAHAEPSAAAAGGADQDDDGLEFQSNPLRDRLIGLESEQLNDGSQNKAAAVEPATSTQSSRSNSTEKRAAETAARPAASSSSSSSAAAASASDDEWSARLVWVRRNLPSIEVISVVALLSLLLNLFLLLAVIPSLRSDVSYLSGRADSLQSTVGNLNGIVTGMGSRIDAAQAQIMGFHATADAVMHRVALASSALDLKLATATTTGDKRTATDRCGN